MKMKTEVDRTVEDMAITGEARTDLDLAIHYLDFDSFFHEAMRLNNSDFSVFCSDRGVQSGPARPN